MPSIPIIGTYKGPYFDQCGENSKNHENFENIVIIVSQAKNRENHDFIVRVGRSEL